MELMITYRVFYFMDVYAFVIVRTINLVLSGLYSSLLQNTIVHERNFDQLTTVELTDRVQGHPRIVPQVSVVQDIEEGLARVSSQGPNCMISCIKVTLEADPTWVPPCVNGTACASTTSRKRHEILSTFFVKEGKNHDPGTRA